MCLARTMVTIRHGKMPLKASALPCARAPEPTGLAEVAKLSEGGREIPNGRSWALRARGHIRHSTAS
jgi:hypothetical protein